MARPFVTKLPASWLKPVWLDENAERPPGYPFDLRLFRGDFELEFLRKQGERNQL